MIQVPRATYRLQLNAEFTFRDATALVPYLARLGVSHVYCSPYFKARPGSMHGYDVVDHNSFNPEIGTAEDFEGFVATLRAHQMGHIVDFVPNHVGIGSDNAWWMDVLENGATSPLCPLLRYRLVGHGQAAHPRARRELWGGAGERRAAAAA